MSNNTFSSEEMAAVAGANRDLQDRLDSRDRADLSNLAKTVGELSGVVRELTIYVKDMKETGPDMEKRLRKLEIWQGWIIGAGAAITAVLTILIPLVFKLADAAARR